MSRRIFYFIIGFLVVILTVAASFLIPFLWTRLTIRNLRTIELASVGGEALSLSVPVVYRDVPREKGQTFLCVCGDGSYYALHRGPDGRLVFRRQYSFPAGLSVDAAYLVNSPAAAGKLTELLKSANAGNCPPEPSKGAFQ